MVLAGANGSGKSTLLELPTLFGELLASNDINDVFFEVTPSQNEARASTPIELLHQLQGHTFSLSLEVQIPKPIQYELSHSLDITVPSVNFQPAIIRYTLAFELINHEQFQIAQEHLLLLLKPEQSPYQIIQRDKGKQTSTFQAEGQSQTFQFTISPKQLALSSLPADHRFFFSHAFV